MSDEIRRSIMLPTGRSTSLAAASSGPDDRVVGETSSGTAERLLAAQREYYDLRAPDYSDVRRPADRAHRGAMPSEQVRAALRELRISGHVLELACGSGAFTRELVKEAASLTAVDASPQMIDINQRVVGDPSVKYVCADIFGWAPPRQFDLVFFGFWLSHVPETHFSTFWAMVRASLRPGGRCVFIDEDDRAQCNEAAWSDGPVPTATRALSDGRSFDIVKVFWDPTELERRLARERWAASVRRVGATFLLGEAAAAAPVGE